MDNIEIIQRALNVEIKNKYINIRGKKQYFSDFMKSNIRKIMKTSPMPEKWKAILQCFDMYATSTMPERKNYIELFVKLMRLELKNKENTNNNSEVLNPHSDVTYVKGVGTKVASILNKLGIFTPTDLMFYFPRKHIDYSQRTPIKHLSEGQTTTIFGYIK